MAVIVAKFGGTSVADVERIERAADKIAREVQAGNQVAVVVSAMSGVTNTALLAIAAKSASFMICVNMTSLSVAVSKLHRA